MYIFLCTSQSIDRGHNAYLPACRTCFLRSGRHRPERVFAGGVLRIPDLFDVPQRGVAQTHLPARSSQGLPTYRYRLQKPSVRHHHNVRQQPARHDQLHAGIDEPRATHGICLHGDHCRFRFGGREHHHVAQHCLGYAPGPQHHLSIANRL